MWHTLDKIGHAFTFCLKIQRCQVCEPNIIFLLSLLTVNNRQTSPEVDF